MNTTVKNYIVTGIIAIVAVVFIYPFARPLLQKIPVIGQYA
jgi:hypothetical protein